MDNHQHPVRLHHRLLSWAISAMLATQPLLPAVAATLTPSAPGIQIDKAGNGVPVVNIATPNGAGISHNQFKDYNVGKEGIILNNATGQLNQTQLGGLIQNNPNLKAGQEARGIINEVNGGNRSQLQGFTEVAGKAANVMVANPYGITCNGCGFINTPNVTLTTGKPVFDASGNLQSLNVTKGAITIEGQGLNASQTDALSIIARATEVNTAIHAKDLKIIAGANRVDAKGNATAIAGEGAAPAVAVDTGALGGMYANRIRLVSSEKGVGVNLGNLNARQGDISLDTSGKLSIKNSLASGSLSAKGQSVTLAGEHKAGGPMTIAAQNDVATEDAQLASDGSLFLSGNGNVTLKNSRLTAGRNLNVRAGNLTQDSASRGDAGSDINIALTGTATTQGQIVAGKNVALKAAKLNHSGLLAANGDARLDTPVLNNRGSVQSQKNLAVSGSSLNNSGKMLAGSGLDIATQNLTQSGTISAKGPANLTVTNRLTNAVGGQILSDDALVLHASDIRQSGTLLGKKSLAVTGGQLNATTGSLTTSQGDISLSATDTTLDGDVIANGNLAAQATRLGTQANARLQSDGTITLKAQNATLNGTQTAKENLSVTADRLVHNGKSHAAAVSFNATALSNRGILTAPSLNLTAKHLVNEGQLQGDRLLTLSATQFDNLAGGSLYSAYSLALNLPQFTNAGIIASDGDISLQTDALTNSGVISSGTKAQLAGNSLNNSGEINAAALDLNYSQVLNQAPGLLLSKSLLGLKAGSLTNLGTLAGESLRLNATTVSNGGLLQGTNALSLQGERIDIGDGGRLLTAGTLALTASQLTTNGVLQGQHASVTANSWLNGGSLLGTESVSVDIAKNLTNRGDILSQGNTTLGTQSLDNSGVVMSAGEMTLSGSELSNSGSLQASNLTFGQTQVENKGTIIGLNQLTLAARMDMAAPLLKLVNSGRLLTQGALTINGGDISNDGIWQGQNILLNAQRLDNDGAIQSADALTLNLTGDLFSATNSKITANGRAAINALNLSNDGKWIAKQLILTGNNLKNNGDISGVNGLSVTLNDAFSQRSGKTLLSGGALVLKAAAVDNGGQIQGRDAQISTGSLNNSGRVQGGNTLVLDAGNSLNNGAKGVILSEKTLHITTPALINFGIVQGGESTVVDAGSSVRNEGKLLAGNVLTLNAATLNNNGWLQATTLLLNAAAASNAGTLMSQQGTLTGNAFTNGGTVQGADLLVNYKQLTNDGTLFGTKSLTINADKVNHRQTGKLYSGGNLLLTSAGFDQLGQIIALGNLTLKLSDAFTGKNVIAAGDMLSITSNGAITNQSVMQGQAVNLNAGGVLTNNAQITTGSGDSTLSGSRIAMNAAGMLQAGGDVTLNSRSDINVDGFLGTAGSLTLNAVGSLLNTALLYAGNNMYLLANSIKNQRGDILAGNSLWMQRDMAGNANAEVVNTSGNIETQKGDITVRTGYLLNEAEGLTISQYEREYPDVIPGLNGGLSGWYSGEKKPDFDVDIKEWKHNGDNIVWRSEEECAGSGAIGSGGCRDVYYYRLKGEDTRRYLLGESVVSVSATGGAARIAAGRDLAINAGTLDNRASHILAERNATLKGDTLNNLSAEGGRQAIYVNAEYRCEWFYNDCDSSRWQPLVKLNENTWAWASSRKSGVVPYILGERTTEFTPDGSALRAVIQAGGNVTTNFTNDISNTTTTANAGGVSNTISAPTLNTLSTQSIDNAQQGIDLASANAAAVNSPEWHDNLANAVAQISGGNSLSQQQGGLYPLPSGNNGYFVTSTDPNSPYLIAINPKLDGLGQLDRSLFGDLYDLMGIKPGSAPRETNSNYTDQNKFLGSAYFLDRLNLHPEYDYRFLGDAAFDTRYVSNYMLHQTGSRYINGIGSDLDQMQYLMDNAANARTSLGLKFGVALTAAQIAALDKSIIWWEAATVNGQTVMMPKVYLSPKDVTVSNGSVIAGNNVQLAGGNITNSGSTLTANNNLSIDSQNSVSNLNAGLINAGGNLKLDALGDINNIGSMIAGKTVALESIGGGISNVTLTEQWKVGGSGRSGNIHLSGTDSGPTASITASDGLSLSAGKDISITGANVGAGGSLLMRADGNISVTANEMSSSYSQSDFRGREVTGKAAVTHQGSTLTAGGSMGMQAGNDLTLAASAVNAGGNATLVAGNDLNLNAAQTGESASRGKSETHSTDIARTTVSSGGDLQLAAGRDITSQAAGLAAENDVAMQAGRDVNLLAQETTEGSSYKSSKKKEITESVRQQGTEIASGGNTKIIAGRDVNAEAAQVIASGDIGVGADRNINLTTATESDYHYKEETKTKKGFLKKTTTHTVEENSATYEKGSSLSGNNVSLTAGNDLTVKGSNVIGDGAVTLKAGNDVNVLAATEEQSTYRLKEKKKSGLMGSGGLGVTVGSKSSRHQVNEDGITQSQSVSTVGSTGGNVSIIADGKAHISGADVVAAKNLNVVAGEIQVDPGNDLLRRQERYEQKQSGVTLSVSSAVTDAAMAANNAFKRGEEVSDDRLKALYAVKAAENAWIAGSAGVAVADAVAQGNMNAVKVEVSVGSGKATSESDLTQNQVRGSNLSAGGDVTMVATGGKGTSGDLHITGSGVTGDKVTLVAQNDLLLDAATNNSEQSSKNNSSGWNVGVHMSLGQETGIGVSASGYQLKGTADGKSTEYVNTRVNARDELSMSSGRDTVIAGAQALGEKITAGVGRDLVISSLQDTDEYHSKQTDVSGGASFTFGSMTGSASMSINKSKIDSNYASVGEQSGLFAGDKGFDINVGKHTWLDGAVIASTATADKNHLDTGTLGWNAIENNADYSASSKGISGGFSSGNNNAGERVNSGGAVPIIGTGSHGDATGTTQSAIAAGSITVRDEADQKQDVAGLSRDTDSANGSIDKIFDKKKIEEQQELAAVFGQMTNQVAGDLGVAMGWSADSKEKAAIHGVIGAIQASFGGGNALAGGIAGLGSEVFGQLVNDYLSSHTTLDGSQKAAITQWAAAVSGGAMGGVIAGSNGAQSGAAASLDSVRFNYLDHKEAERKLQVESQLKSGDLKPEQRQALQEELANINATDKARDELIGDICSQGNKSSAACTQLVVKAQTALGSYDGSASYNLKYKDIFPEDYANASAIMQGLDAGSITRDAAIVGIAEKTGKPWLEVAKTYDDVMQLHAIASIIAGSKMSLDGVLPGKGGGAATGNKLSYVEEPPFKSSGTAGAAQPWSTKGRIKHVELPTQGKIRFVPDSNYSPSNPLPRGPNNGYIDKFGNEWVKGPSRTAGQAFEWDVQLSPKGKAQLGWATRDGSHINISLDGKVTHK